MIKKITKYLLFLILISFIIISYLSFFGINTNKFNDRIKSKILDKNSKINLKLKSVEFLLDPFNFSINIKSQDPEILINNSKLELEYIKTKISLKSFIYKDFSISDLKISTKKINLKDLILMVRSFKNSAELFILDSIVKEGSLVGVINLRFNSAGEIKDDYEFKGFIKKGKIDFAKKYTVNNLNLVFNIKNKKYYFKEVKGSFNEIKLVLPTIEIEEKNNEFLINGKLVNEKEDLNIEKLNNFLGTSFKNFNIKNFNFSSTSNFNFIINKKFKVSNFNINSIIDLKKIVYDSNLLNIKKYLPNLKKLINLEDHLISINYKKNKLEISGKGKIIIENKVDTLDYRITKINDKYNFNTNLNINNSSIIIDILRYEKKENIDSVLKLNGFYKKNKTIFLKSILYKENDNQFLIKGLVINNKFNVSKIKSIKLDYINNNKIQNQINFKKDKKKSKIYGKSFDASKLIDEILKDDTDDKTSSIFKNINSNFDIKIEKMYLDKITFVNDLIGSVNFKKNKINKLNLKSIFQNNKKLVLSIHTNKNNEKITTLFSDFPQPLIKRYKFIKGFESGVLDFYSIKKNNVSNSILKIDNFKLREVPILAKLLTLASLNGIADLLTGEGIRFTDFEMKFSNKKKLMTIDELYAIGPAISILMEGYIESEKLISLRGVMVPATTINRAIASIPLIGDILVGKKVGDGVFGVSFKVKGAPKKLKTTVNPIKTLTPRFITRILEKIKKN